MIYATIITIDFTLLYNLTEICQLFCEVWVPERESVYIKCNWSSIGVDRHIPSEEIVTNMQLF